MVSSVSASHARRGFALSLLLAGVFLLCGLVVTFTPTLHETVAIDTLLASVSLGVFAFSHFARALPLRDGTDYLLGGVTALAAFFASPLFVHDIVHLTLVTVTWLVVYGLVNAVMPVRDSHGARDRNIFLILHGLTAIALLLVMRDPVAVTGFFGTYALIRGFLIALTSFDARFVLRALHERGAQ